MQNYWHLGFFCNYGNDTQTHLHILSQVSLMNEEVTLTMSKVPCLAKAGKTTVAVKWRVMDTSVKVRLRFGHIT